MEASGSESFASTNLSSEKGSPKSASLPKKRRIRSKPTSKKQQTNRIAFQKGGLPDGILLNYALRGEILRSGYKQGIKIYCLCCYKEVSPSTFEAHAGHASRKKPYENIFTSNGLSLHQYASATKLNSEHVAKKNDAMCRVCRRKEELLLCEGCPRSFHKECLKESIIYNEGKWFCKICRNSMRWLKRKRNAEALAAGVNHIQEIEEDTGNNPENSGLIACVLCRSYEFSENGFSDQMVIGCDQCEKEYHIGCLRESRGIKLRALPKAKWFCGTGCRKLNSVINKLLTSEPEKVPDSLMALTKQKEGDAHNFDVKWVLLRGKHANHEVGRLLTEAVALFHDCFDPIIDDVNECDYIPAMVYGLKMGCVDFSGTLCGALMINSKVVTAGVFRVFGHDFAELPLVATSKSHQGKGYFQVFYACFEKLLKYLKVNKVLVPAADSATTFWTDKLDFRLLSAQQFHDYWQTWTSMVSFVGTTLMQKEVPKGLVTLEDDADFSISIE